MPAWGPCERSGLDPCAGQSPSSAEGAGRGEPCPSRRVPSLRAGPMGAASVCRSLRGALPPPAGCGSAMTPHGGRVRAAVGDGAGCLLAVLGEPKLGELIGVGTSLIGVRTAHGAGHLAAAPGAPAVGAFRAAKGVACLCGGAALVNLCLPARRAVGFPMVLPRVG